jgi:L-asparagine oxygenase
MISDAREAVMSLPADDQSTLRRPLYTFQVPASFSMDHGYSGPRPIVVGPTDAPQVRINLNPGHTLTSDPHGLTALTDLAARLDARAFEVALAPGDLLVINNNSAVHGRPPFARAGDGEDRWLRRVYVKRDLWRPGSGVLPPARLVRATQWP